MTHRRPRASRITNHGILARRPFHQLLGSPKTGFGRGLYGAGLGSRVRSVRISGRELTELAVRPRRCYFFSDLRWPRMVSSRVTRAR
jgi:hypothetical protein